MQCEFTKAELIKLELSVMVRLSIAMSARDEKKYDKVLETNIMQLEALHNKLNDLITQAEIAER